MEEVNLEWRGPYRLEYLSERKATQEHGIYAISRRWGWSESLLYIGQSYFQCMLDKTWCHENEWIYQYTGEMLIRFCKIILDEGYENSQRLTNDIEALLIYSELPIHNIQHKESYRGRPLQVWNEGQRGVLDEYICSFNL